MSIKQLLEVWLFSKKGSNRRVEPMNKGPPFDRENHRIRMQRTYIFSEHMFFEWIGWHDFPHKQPFHRFITFTRWVLTAGLLRPLESQRAASSCQQGVFVVRKAAVVFGDQLGHLFKQQIFVYRWFWGTLNIHELKQTFGSNGCTNHLNQPFESAFFLIVPLQF